MPKETLTTSPADDGGALTTETVITIQKDEPKGKYAYERSYTILGNSLDELITECLSRIRENSQAFYATEIRQRLQKEGYAIIDKFAGMGNFYTVKLQ